MAMEYYWMRKIDEKFNSIVTKLCLSILFGNITRFSKFAMCIFSKRDIYFFTIILHIPGIQVRLSAPNVVPRGHEHVYLLGFVGSTMQVLELEHGRRRLQTSSIKGKG